MTLKVDYGILVRHRNCHGGGELGETVIGEACRKPAAAGPLQGN